MALHWYRARQTSLDSSLLCSGPCYSTARLLLRLAFAHAHAADHAVRCALPPVVVDRPLAERTLGRVRVEHHRAVAVLLQDVRRAAMVESRLHGYTFASACSS